MSKVVVMDHPLIQHKIGIIRRTETSSKEFREMIGEIAMLMCFEATRDLPLEEVTVETPVAVAKCHRLAGKKLAIVPILRAGLGMVDGMVSLIPNAKVGHIGLFRDPETHEPVKYYYKMPADIAERDIIVVDPMLATGGSAIYSEPAMKHLSEIGRVVYLKISFDELKCRLADFSERGVVMRDGIGMSLRDLYDERLPLYEKYADITVDVNDLSITAAARKVAAALK